MENNHLHIYAKRIAHIAVQKVIEQEVTQAFHDYWETPTEAKFRSRVVKSLKEHGFPGVMLEHGRHTEPGDAHILPSLTATRVDGTDSSWNTITVFPADEVHEFHKHYSYEGQEPWQVASVGYEHQAEYAGASFSRKPRVEKKGNRYVCRQFGGLDI